MATHLWLGDAWEPGWEVSNLICVLGAVLLVFRPSLVAWILIFVGKLLPLLFLRDQLTQSVVLLCYSTAGIWAHLLLLRGKDPLPDFFRSMHWVTGLTYSLATLHKLNTEFLNPVTSCANYGINKLAIHWQVPTDVALWSIWPGVALLIEGAIPLLLMLGRHRIAWVLAVLFHIPLTITMAPAFAFVMFAGLAAFVTDEDRETIFSIIERHWKWIIPLSVSITAISVLRPQTTPDPSMIVREWMLWALLLLLATAFPLWKRKSWTRRALPKVGLAPKILAGLFLLNGLTPYTGVQIQHAAAMLSNLRIDEGCWNHVIIPESMRLTEDYIRIETGYFGKPGVIPEYEKIMTDQLWNGPQIRQMKRNWCGHKVRPFYIEGTFRGRQFVIPDLCSAEELPFHDDGFFGVEIFPDFLRYQKNLMRECPQACIH